MWRPGMDFQRAEGWRCRFLPISYHDGCMDCTGFFSADGNAAAAVSVFGTGSAMSGRR